MRIAAAASRTGWMVPYADEDVGRLVTAWTELASAFLLGRGT
jgi:hypothetical protein